MGHGGGGVAVSDAGNSCSSCNVFCGLPVACVSWLIFCASYFCHRVPRQIVAHVTSADCCGSAASGGELAEATWHGGMAGAARLHDINGAHFVHFICVICQPKCVAFSLLIYRGRTGYI